MLWKKKDIDEFFGNHPDCATKAIALPVLYEYIDEEDHSLFLPSKYGFRASFETSKAALYGKRPTSLMFDLVRFSSFPGSLQEFGCRYYRVPGKVWITNKNRTICYKQEVFSKLIQQFQFPGEVRNRYNGEHIMKYVNMLCDMHLEYKERTLLNGICEFTEIDNRKLNEFKEEICRILEQKSCYNGKLTINEFKNSIEKQFKSVCPHLDDSQLKHLLDKIENKLDFATYPDDYFTIVRYSLTFIINCEMFIHKHESWFTVSEEVEPPLVVRRFYMGKNKEEFFLASELLEVIWRRKLDGGELEEELEEMRDDDELATIGIKELQEKWAEHVKGVEFDEIEYIQYDILRTKRRALYIPYNKTEYCILATDAFMELLRWLVSVRKLFLKSKEAYFRHIIKKTIFKCPKFKKMDAKGPLLMSLDEIYEVRRFVSNMLTGFYAFEPDTAIDALMEITFFNFEFKSTNPNRCETRLKGLNSCMQTILNIKAMIVSNMKEKLRAKKKKWTNSHKCLATEEAQIAYILVKIFSCYEWFENQGFYPFSEYPLVKTFIERIRNRA